MANLAKNLEKFRTKAGITRNKLAKVADVEAATVYRIESGKQENIEVETAKKLAKALDIRPSQLLDIS